MLNKSLLGLLTIAILAMSVAPANGRPIANWPYEQLLKEADLVVIASVKSTVATDDRLKDNPWKAEFLGLNTAFSVKGVLKGKTEGDSIKVLHYKLKEGVSIINGPLLVTFRSNSMLLEGKSKRAELGPPDYLLFLKLRKDGRYEPVTGQIDPQLSVRELYRFVPDLSGK
jgi:hypothetical protein